VLTQHTFVGRCTQCRVKLDAAGGVKMVYSCTKCHGSLHPVDEGAHWKCEDCNQVFSIDYLVGFVAGKMSAAKAMEKRGTDAQQLRAEIAALEAVVEKFTSTNSSSTKLADDIECAKQWLLPQRPVTQVEVDACIKELDVVISQLRT